MEWRDVLSWIVPLGIMFVLMRSGGCCGGHRHNGSRHHTAGGCCGGVNNKDTVAEKDDRVASDNKETEKKSCH